MSPRKSLSPQKASHIESELKQLILKHGHEIPEEQLASIAAAIQDGGKSVAGNVQPFLGVIQAETGVFIASDGLVSPCGQRLRILDATERPRAEMDGTSTSRSWTIRKRVVRLLFQFLLRLSGRQADADRVDVTAKGKMRIGPAALNHSYVLTKLSDVALHRGHADLAQRLEKLSTTARSLALQAWLPHKLSDGFRRLTRAAIANWTVSGCGAAAPWELEDATPAAKMFHKQLASAIDEVREQFDKRPGNFFV